MVAGIGCGGGSVALSDLPAELEDTVCSARVECGRMRRAKMAEVTPATTTIQNTVCMPALLASQAAANGSSVSGQVTVFMKPT